MSTLHAGDDRDDGIVNGPDGTLRERLAALSEPRTPPEPIWKAAMASQRAARGSAGRFGRSAGARRPVAARRTVAARRVMAAAAVLVLGGATVAVILPALGKARASARFPRVDSSAEPAFALKRPPSSPASAQVPRQDAGASPAPLDSVRSVARKASIELLSPDVRTAYVKAAAIATDALGEFVENASLTGDGAHARGELTLRLRQERLTAALNQVRELGVVAAESTGGVDVTDRLIDLDATIRNEKQVEAEILDLLNRRAKDAGLKDIVELRNTLGEARKRIETLEAQRDNAARSVRFATVLVIIQHKDEPVPAAPQRSMGQVFSEQITAAWHAGVGELGASLGWCVEVGLSRLPLWIGLGAAGLAGIGVVRRAARWSLLERPPAIG